MSEEEPAFEDHAAFHLTNLWETIRHYRRAAGKVSREKGASAAHLHVRHENGRQLFAYFHPLGTKDPLAIVAEGWDRDPNALCVGVPLGSPPGHDFLRAAAWQWLFDEKLDLEAIGREVKGIRVERVGANVEEDLGGWWERLRATPEAAVDSWTGRVDADRNTLSADTSDGRRSLRVVVRADHKGNDPPTELYSDQRRTLVIWVRRVEDLAKWMDGILGFVEGGQWRAKDLAQKRAAEASLARALGVKGDG